MQELNLMEVEQVAGGARTDKGTCDEAGGKWTKDKETEKDGKGTCKMP